IAARNTLPPERDRAGAIGEPLTLARQREERAAGTSDVAVLLQPRPHATTVAVEIAHVNASSGVVGSHRGADRLRRRLVALPFPRHTASLPELIARRIYRRHAPRASMRDAFAAIFWRWCCRARCFAARTPAQSGTHGPAFAMIGYFSFAGSRNARRPHRASSAWRSRFVFGARLPQPFF